MHDVTSGCLNNTSFLNQIGKKIVQTEVLIDIFTVKLMANKGLMFCFSKIGTWQVLIIEPRAVYSLELAKGWLFFFDFRFIEEAPFHSILERRHAGAPFYWAFFGESSLIYFMLGLGWCSIFWSIIYSEDSLSRSRFFIGVDWMHLHNATAESAKKFQNASFW